MAGLSKRLADSFFSVFFPESCRVCELPLVEASRVPVCPDCLETARPFGPRTCCKRCAGAVSMREALDAEGICGACRLDPPAYDRAVSYGPYNGTLRKLIHLLKYDGVTPLARELGARLANAAASAGPGHLATSAPLHWRRHWSRGFNQAELLARVVAQRLGIPFEKRALERVRPTPPQAGLSRSQRHENLRGAFRAGRREFVNGKTVFVIDDVMTTGATLEACAKALRRAGAAEVVVLSVARAELGLRGG